VLKFNIHASIGRHGIDPPATELSGIRESDLCLAKELLPVSVPFGHRTVARSLVTEIGRTDIAVRVHEFVVHFAPYWTQCVQVNLRRDGVTVRHGHSRASVASSGLTRLDGLFAAAELLSFHKNFISVERKIKFFNFFVFSSPHGFNSREGKNPKPSKYIYIYIYFYIKEALKKKWAFFFSLWAFSCKEK
jgi:hypothetical protein